MSDRPPQVPDPYAKYFRDPPAAAPASPPDDMSPYEAYLRGEQPPAGQNRAMPSTSARPAGTAAATAAPPAPVRLPAPKRKRPLWRRIVRWVAVLLAILLGYAIFLLGYLVANINKIDAMPAEQIRNTSGAVTLIVGSDERSSDPGGGGRTDTIMLLVDPLFGAPTLMSVPRDSWVSIPGRGNGKINSAFAIGGPPLLIETVEENTGLHVDHYMEIGFEGVVWITDAVGGLRLCIDFDVDDPNSGLDMDAGCSVLEGQQALAFIRMRYSDPKGDLGRIQRQQQYISSLITTVMKPQVFLNPVKMVRVVRAAADALTVDKNTGVVNLMRFGLGMAQVGRGSGELTTVPISNPSAWRGGQSVVLWDDGAAEQLFESLGAR